MSNHHSDSVGIIDASDGSLTAEEFRRELHISKTTWNTRSAVLCLRSGMAKLRVGPLVRATVDPQFGWAMDDDTPAVFFLAASSTTLNASSTVP